MLFSPNPARRRRLQLRISERRLLLMAGDALAVILSVLIALWVWARVAEYRFDMDFILPQVAWFFLLSSLWFILSSANGYYELSLAARRIASIQRLIVITLQLLVVYLIVFFLSDRNALPRLFILYYGLISFGLLALSRVLNPVLLGWASAPRRLLIIGADDNARIIIQALRRFAPGAYEIRGIIGQESQVGEALDEVAIIGTAADLMNFVNRDSIREIVTTSTRMSGEVFQAVMDAYERGLTITPMPLLYERISERVPVENVGEHWMVVLPMGERPTHDVYPLLKRLFDVSVSLLGLLILGLFLPLIALLIRLDSSGTIFYRQTRVGRNGRLFQIVKFRSMVMDAEKFSGAVFSQRDDPRVTRMGRIMRKTRIDELPQFWNILRGEMSLIGPRPERPEHVSRLQAKIPFYRTRLLLRPGVTGWAQVRYHYGADDQDALIKLQYDLYYMRHQSLLLDINILIRTVGQVLRLTGQ